MFERKFKPSRLPEQQSLPQPTSELASHHTPNHSRPEQQAASPLNAPPPDLSPRDFTAEQWPRAQEASHSSDARQRGDIPGGSDKSSPLYVDVTTTGKEFLEKLANAHTSPDGKEHLGVFFRPIRDAYGRLDLRPVGVKRLSDLAREHQSNTGERVYAIVGELQGMGKLNGSVGNDAEKANGIISEFASVLERTLGQSKSPNLNVLLQGRIDKDRFAVIVSGASRADVVAASERAQEQLVLFSGNKSLPNGKPLPEATRMHVGVGAFDGPTSGQTPFDKEALQMVESNEERGDGVVASGPRQEVKGPKPITLAAGQKVTPMRIPSDWVMNPDAAVAHAFELHAQKAGIPPEAVQKLKPKVRRDELTGAFDGRDGMLLNDMINRARHHHAEDPNNKFQLVSVDVANLGGMNGVRGMEEADRHVKEMIGLASEHFSSQEAEVAVVRAGGDEFYLFVRGKEIDFEASIEAIELSVSQYAEQEKLHLIEHTKKDEGRPPGVKLYLGTAEIRADQTAVQIRSNADRGIDEKKASNIQH